jgi:hypothetical protein
MLDRETRILEMAKDMCFHADSCTVGAENKCCTLNCETTWAAEKLVDKNYQKINPDDIVISKTEYERLKLLSEINTDFKQLRTNVEEALSINSSDIERVEKQATKNTAEKSYSIVKDIINQHYALETPSTRVTLSQVINQVEKAFIKSFGISIKE